MATLKSKRSKKAEIEAIEQEVEKTAPVEEPTLVEEEVPATTESPYLNDAEQKALAEQHENDEENSRKVSIAKMEKAVEVVSDMFNLYGHNFVMNGFADKGSKFQLSMSNGDFDIVVTIKDSEKFGIL